MFGRISGWCYQHRIIVLVVWIAVLGAGFAASGPVFNALGEKTSANFESAVGSRLIDDNNVDLGTVVAVLDHVDPASAATAAAVNAAERDLRGQTGVRAVDDPYNSGPDGAKLISSDRHAVMVIAHIARNVPSDQRNSIENAAQTRMRALAGALPGSQVQVGGDLILNREINATVQSDLSRAELISLPITLLFMVLVFGGFVAAGLPVLGAVASIAAAMLGLWALSTFAALDNNTVTVTTLLGLGLSIDYGLLLLSRHRDELAKGRSRLDAVRVAGATAGRTIAFSALTVAAALGGLLVVDVPFLQAIGAAGLSVALVTMCAALTLIPALIRLAGKWIKPARHVDGTRQGLFARLAGGVQRHPVAVLGVTGLALIIAILPVLGVKITDPQLQGIPTSIESRRVLDISVERFGQPETAAAVVVARTDRQALNSWAASQRTDPGVVRVGAAQNVGGGLSSVEFQVAGDPAGEQARTLVTTLRADRPQGAQSWVTGTGASFKDELDQLDSGLPLAIGVSVAAMLLLLFLMTGSVVIPLKALLMNLISTGATFGIMVAVFQHGFLSGPLGLLVTDGLNPINLVVVFAFAFGLSMDYEMFLLSRIKEQHDAGAPNDIAVREGLRRSARIITSAAACMLIVFGCFIPAHLSDIQQIGLGLVLAVLIDATIVRCLLVPATMTLLGRFNWWAPRWMTALHKRFGLQEQSAYLRNPDDDVDPARRTPVLTN
jgi:RND superfamily putative drug exporter